MIPLKKKSLMVIVVTKHMLDYFSIAFLHQSSTLIYFELHLILNITNCVFNQL